jgi:hypothetical protein
LSSLSVSFRRLFEVLKIFFSSAALATFDGSQSSDYEELQASPNSLSAPPIVKKAPPKAIYVSPDLEDIRDQQSYDVFHDVVRGAILMPKIKFSLRDDDDCIREADDDSEGRQLSPGEAGTADEDMGGAQTQTVGPPRPRMLRPTRKRRVPRPPVRVFPNPLFKRTIEEMIPYSKIPFSEDTYIVMADDPVRQYLSFSSALSVF